MALESSRNKNLVLGFEYKQGSLDENEICFDKKVNIPKTHEK